jgi:hypothetical protein
LDVVDFIVVVTIVGAWAVYCTIMLHYYRRKLREKEGEKP